MCCAQEIREVIGELNPVLRGWGGYFRTGNVSDKFNQVDCYVRERLLKLLVRRSQCRWRTGTHPFRSSDRPHRHLVEDHGLYRLQGNLCYPGGTHVT